MVLRNPIKERDTWKGKNEAMEQKCSTYHKKLGDFLEKTKLTEPLQEKEKMHNSPSTLVSQVAELESPFEAKKISVKKLLMMLLR